MNRRLLIVPVVGAAVFAGSQFIAGSDSELPPEPVFPTVVGSPDAQDWTADGWSVNRFVDDPFQPSLSTDNQGFDVAPPTGPAAELDAEPPTDTVVDSTTTSPAASSAPTPTTAAPAPSTTTPTTTAPPLAAPEPGGADVPAIDDLPGPEADLPAPDADSDR